MNRQLREQGLGNMLNVGDGPGEMPPAAISF
jgi:hypothetical protein